MVCSTYIRTVCTVRTFINTAIDQVTGVRLTCEPVELASQCTVMWNVSLLCIHMYVCIYSHTQTCVIYIMYVPTGCV